MTVRLKEWVKPLVAGDWTQIEVTDTNKVISVLLREENNLIHLNNNHEIYTDLQIANNIQPTDNFEVWVTTGRVLESNGRPHTWTLLHYETTSWDYCQWLYGTDTNMYFDWWDGNWRQVYYSDQANEIFIRWLDFYWQTKTWATITLDLSSEITPTSDFVVNAPTNVKEWQVYILRVNNGSTVYAMTLWNGIINTQGTNINLTAQATDMFVFLAIKLWGNIVLELQKEMPQWWWWIYYFYLDNETDQTELDKLWAWWNTLPNDPDEFDNSVIMIDYWNGSWQYPTYSPTWRYYYKTQDSADMYFFWDNYKLKVQFQMQWWYTRIGVYSVTIEPLYTAWTGINIIGGQEIECTLTPWTKTFHMQSDYSDIATVWAQIASWLSEWETLDVSTFKDATIMVWVDAYDRIHEYVENSWQYRISFIMRAPTWATHADWTSSSKFKLLRFVFSYNNGTWTYVSSDTTQVAQIVNNYLRTDYDYPTPYEPEYDWSPITLYYFDENAVKYENFETSTAVWATLTISHFTTQITPSANFTLVAWTVKEWMQYIIRVNSWATAYTMSLGTWVTNPFTEDLTLTANKTTTIVLLATSSSTLEVFSVRTAD